MTVFWNCPKCGAEVPAEFTFCLDCHTPRPDQEVEGIGSAPRPDQEAAHTPGPWKADHAGFMVHSGDGQKVIARVDYWEGRNADVREADANLRLIASAPAIKDQRDDLLEALKHVKACGLCAMDDWELCEGGQKALLAIEAASTPTEGGSND